VRATRVFLGLFGATLLVAVVATPAQASANLIVNGDFSSPAVAVGNYSLVSTGSSLSGWRVVGAPGDVAVMSGTFVQDGFTFDAEGQPQWLDLTGISNSATGVEQSVPTEIGVRYVLRFSVGNVYDPGGIFSVSSTVAVSLNGVPLITVTNSRGKGSTRQVWESFQTSFVATTTVSVIEFLNKDPSDDTDNGLLDVRLTESGSPIVPSTITTTIPTPRQALLPLKSLAVNGGIAAAVALLLTFPSQLFNQTLQENYAEINLWWRKRLRRLHLPPRRTAKDDGQASAQVEESGALARDFSYLEKRSVFAAVFVAGAIANAFNDGHFGFSLSSLVTLTAVACAMAIGVAIPAMVGTIYHNKRHGSSPRKLIAIPGGLALAVAMVVVSRLINFEPGYLYGFVCGVLFTRELPSNEKGHLAAIGVCTTLALSAVSWVAWVPVNAAAERQGAFVGVVLLDDLLGALFVSGLVGSFFGMLPIRGLPGWTVKQWNIGAWVGAFGISILGLFQILLRPGIAGHGHRPLIVSVILFVAFGAGSVMFHEHFEKKKGPATEAEAEPAPSH
jgi:Protein of unknown function (DUF642)